MAIDTFQPDKARSIRENIRAAGAAQLTTDVSRGLQAAVERNEIERISAENRRWTQWRNGLIPGEVTLYEQGLLIEGTRNLGPALRTVRGFDGKVTTIETEGIKHGGGTLFIPSTKEAQIAHGEIIKKPKSSSV